MPDAIQMPISNFMTRSIALKWLIPIMSLGLLCIHWFNTDLKYNNLLFEVNTISKVSFFETHYLYAYAHLFALIPILCLSFDKKVAFYKEWKYLLPALFIVAVPYWIWDIAKTAEGIWGFNPRYYTVKIVNLPLEEWLFFITFPFASVFIYLCLNAWFPKTKFLDLLRKIDTPLSIFLMSAFFFIGLWHWGKSYTTTTFWIASFILLWQFLYGSKEVRVLFYRMFPLATVPFILVNGVFTGGFTEQPIVVYNPEEYLGLRFFTIPLDDFSYNFGLELAVIALYEWFKSKHF